MTTNSASPTPSASVNLTRYHWAILSSDLSSARRLVAISLALLADNPQGCAWPSYDRLAKITNISRGKVIAHVNALVALGWLRKVSGGGRRADGSGIPNRYFPTLPEPTVPVHAHNPALSGSVISSSLSEGSGRVAEPLHPDHATEANQLLRMIHAACPGEIQNRIDEDWPGFDQKAGLARMLIALRLAGQPRSALVEELVAQLNTARHPVRVMYRRLQQLCRARSVDPAVLSCPPSWDADVERLITSAAHALRPVAPACTPWPSA